jgi:acetolactate synthase-1/2/3 large subunit
VLVTGGDAVVSVLGQAGVEVVFGVVSIHNQPIFDALSRSSIRLVPSRTEAGAVNMADAFARVSGGLGVAVTSTGTGAANAAGSLVEALSASSRVLHLTGQVDARYLDRGCGYIHETRDQLGMLRAISKVALRARSGAVGEAVAEALGELRRFPQGPASIEIPIDLQRAQARPVGLALDEEEGARRPPDPGRVREAAALLRAARRPLIWAGGGVLAAGAEAALGRLVERLGAGLLTSNAGRGCLSEEHPLCVGNFGTSPALGELWSRADLLLSAGTRFRSQETGSYRLPVPPVHVQIDCARERIGACVRVSHPLVGDARLALEAILAELGSEAGAEPGWREEVGRARAEARRRLRETLGPYEGVVDALAEQLGPEDVVVRDVTVASSLWGNRLLPIRRPRTNVFPLGGGIGQGLAMAIGAKLAACARGGTRRVLAMAGDGGLAVNLGELRTAVQERAPITLLVFDDGGYGVLRNLQDARYGGRRAGVDLLAPDFPLLARAMGWEARAVEAAGDFGPALAWALEAQDRGQPAMVVLDLAAIGPLGRPFLPPD